MSNPEIERIVADIRLVAEHVAGMRGCYCGHEATVARVVLQRVDLAALSSLLYSVEFVSRFYPLDPLTIEEFHVYKAARRLQSVLHIIKHNRREIHAQLRAA